MIRPSGFDEIRLVSVRTLRGANFWARRPLTRLDLAVGAFDEISSAEVPGFTEALLSLLPGLVEHRCNIGERGGFVTRLRRGTYAPHIVEHVGLELQAMIGHEVGFGRARGGDRPGEYTVVLEHLHAEVGLRAAALALELVQQVFSGVRPQVEHALAELRTLAGQSDIPPVSGRVSCAVTGGETRAALRGELLRRGAAGGDSVVAVSPAYILQAGLPYARSEAAVILDLDVRDAPGRYHDPALAATLVTVVADAVDVGGWVVAPAGEDELLERLRETGRRIALFATSPGRSGAQLADAIARVDAGHITIESSGGEGLHGSIHGAAPPQAQLAAALVAHLTGRYEPQPEEMDAAHV
jgi:hypothetical protein